MRKAQDHVSNVNMLQWGNRARLRPQRRNKRVILERYKKQAYEIQKACRYDYAHIFTYLLRRSGFASVCGKSMNATAIPIKVCNSFF